MLKSRTSKITATVAMAAAMLVAGGSAQAAGTAPSTSTTSTTSAAAAAPAGASTTATGDYYYVCQYPNGTSLTLTGGTIGSCEGASYVQEYLDGRLLQTINVTGAGTPAEDVSISCVVLIASSTAALVSVVGGGLALVRIAALEATGLNPCP